MSPDSTRSRHAGFTLVEMMAVIVIIGILMFFVLRAVMGGGETVRVQNTRAFLSQVAARIESLETDSGDFPPSTFPRELDPKPSLTNMGGEALVIALYPKDGRQAVDVDDGRLCNTDGDDTRRSVTSFSSSEAFELADDWGNPLAYFHRRDYDETCVYVTTGADGEISEVPVRARVNPVTRDPYNRRSFQLLSAGADGVFGTDDDLGNFDPAEGDGE